MNSNSSTTDPKIDLYLVCENLCFQEDYHAYVKITQVPIAAMYMLFISILKINTVSPRIGRKCIQKKCHPI